MEEFKIQAWFVETRVVSRVGFMGSGLNED